MDQRTNIRKITSQGGHATIKGDSTSTTVERKYKDKGGVKSGRGEDKSYRDSGSDEDDDYGAVEFGLCMDGEE